MIHVFNYWVINGCKSDPYKLDKDLKSENELEKLRDELLNKHQPEHSFFKKETINIDFMFQTRP